MKSRFLFPYKSRFIGLALIIAYFPVMIAKKIFFHGYVDHGHPVNIVDDLSLLSPVHIFNVVAILVVTAGLLLLAFSKEKIEDEQIAQLRLDSLQWTIYFIFILFMLTIIFTNGIDVVHALGINLWLLLLFFIIRFRWKIFQNNRLIDVKEA